MLFSFSKILVASVNSKTYRHITLRSDLKFSSKKSYTDKKDPIRKGLDRISFAVKQF